MNLPEMLLVTEFIRHYRTTSDFNWPTSAWESAAFNVFKGTLNLLLILLFHIELYANI